MKATSPSPTEVLANRRWLWRNNPFPHVIARDVFIEPIYQGLEAAFKDILLRGLSGVHDEQKLVRREGYDAYVMSFLHDVPEPFGIFASSAWLDLLASLFGVNATRDVSIGLHHHVIDSASGEVHNDLNPGWFIDNPQVGGINYLSNLCDYQTGVVSEPALISHEVIRSVSMLFYLNNPPWHEGDGGETGLYHHRDDPIDQPAATAPPVNNSILAFECTPYSYHGFLNNGCHERDSIIIWLHRSKEEVLHRWGEKHIVYW